MTINEAKNAIYYSYKAGEVGIGEAGHFLEMLAMMQQDESMDSENLEDFLQKKYETIVAEQERILKERGEDYSDTYLKKLALSEYVREISYVKQNTSPGSMHETGCSGLVHWDDPERWDGERGRREGQDGEHMYTHG